MKNYIYIYIIYIYIYIYIYILYTYKTRNLHVVDFLCHPEYISKSV